MQAKDVGSFYTLMAKRFLLKYGWDTRYAERGHDLEEDNQDPDDSAVADFISPQDEVDERQEYYYALRTVQSPINSRCMHQILTGK